MAGMTEDKLQLLENTKEGLKTAINATGHTVGDVFSEYPSAVTAYKDEVDAGYAQIAAAITDKGVPTEATDTPAQMAANIGQIETGGGSCTGSMQFEPKNGVKYIYIDGNGGPKSSITATIDSVAIGSFLVVVFASQLSSLTISGGLRYVTDITYDDVSTMGNVYMVTGDFSIY